MTISRPSSRSSNASTVLSQKFTVERLCNARTPSPEPLDDTPTAERNGERFPTREECEEKSRLQIAQLTDQPSSVYRIDSINTGYDQIKSNYIRRGATQEQADKVVINQAKADTKVMRERNVRLVHDGSILMQSIEKIKEAKKKGVKFLEKADGMLHRIR